MTWLEIILLIAVVTLIVLPPSWDPAILLKEEKTNGIKNDFTVH